MTGAVVGDAAPAPGRWVERRVVLLLGLAYGIAFYDRQLLSFLMPFIAQELLLTNLQVGALGAALSLTWAIGAWGFGRVSDRVGVRKPFLLGALVVFSLCSVLSGLAPDFVSLLGSRMLMGAVEGPFLPICLAIVAAVSPSGRQGLNTGIVQNFFGSLLGGAVAPVAAITIAAVLGWRGALWTAALPGFVLALLVWRFVPEPPRAPAAMRQDDGIVALLRHRNVALCAMLSCLLVASAVLCSIFLPLYLTKVRGLSPGQMAGTMAVLGLCPPLGGLLVPWLSDRIGRRPPMIGFAALMTLTPLAALLYQGPVAGLAALLFVGWIGMGTFPLFMAVIPAETVGAARAAGVMGLVIAIGELTGGVAAPLAAGWIADRAGLAAPLVIAAAASALAALVALALRESNPAIRRRRGEAE